MRDSGQVSPETQQIIDGEAALERIYADASVTDKVAASASLRADLDKLYSRQKEIAPLAEAVLQEQVAQALSALGLTTLGQPIPSVLYHSSPVPNALIVSKRDVIEQIVNISVSADLTVDEQAALESRVDAKLNTSSLVVPIGGIGVYPTMVMQTTSLTWLVDTIAHEWTHNYLTLRPLGLLYDNTPEMRTMNETTASISGTEVSAYVLKHFYPELATASYRTFGLISFPTDHPNPGDLPRPPFDFRAEMPWTRCWPPAKLTRPRLIWSSASSSSCGTVSCSANSTRLTSLSTARTPIRPAARPAKTPSARRCGPCVRKALRWLISLTTSPG